MKTLIFLALTLPCLAQEANSAYARLSTYKTLTDASPLAWSLQNMAIGSASVNLAHTTGARALNVSNMLSGGEYRLVIKQDSTGGAALTLGTGCTWNVSGGAGTTLTLTGTASSVDVLTFSYDGTTCWAKLTAQNASPAYAQIAPYATLTDAAPIAWSLASMPVANATVTLVNTLATRAINVSNLLNGGEYRLVINQDSTGGAALTLGTGCTWKVAGGGAGAITLTATANAVDILTFTYDGAVCRATLTANFN